MLRGATTIKLIVLFAIVIAMNAWLFVALRGEPHLRDQINWWALALGWAVVAGGLAFLLSRGVDKDKLPTAGTGLVGGVIAQLALLGAAYWWGEVEARPPVGLQAEFELPDDAKVGDVVGTVKFEPGNPGPLHYQRVFEVGSSTDMFEIDRETGVVRLVHTKLLDARSWPDFLLVVRASDEYGASGTTQVRVTITDANQPPVIREGPEIVFHSYTDPGTDLGEVLDADDQDDDRLRYAIVGGNDSGLFAIDELSGHIRITDARKPRESATFPLELEVTDGRSAPVRGTVTMKFTFIPAEPLLQ